MKIQTYTVIAGSTACNARCPYCVSKMTPSQGMDAKLPPVNWRNFHIGCGFAKDSGVSTVLLTGKGEPTLFPDRISEFLLALHPYGFPFMELQTNGIAIFKQQEKYADYLKDWYALGLTTIAISIVYDRDAENEIIFKPTGGYISLTGLIARLHSVGFSVRLSCTMLRNFVDCPRELINLTKFAKKNGVEQLTVRPVAMPDESVDSSTAAWVEEHMLSPAMLEEINSFVRESGKELMRLMHGAVVYDVQGQNLCLTNCLTIVPSQDEVRQLIFFPDGHLRYDWQYPGAILL